MSLLHSNKSVMLLVLQTNTISIAFLNAKTQLPLENTDSI